MTENYYLGADLGGTQLRLAAIDREGHLLTEIFSLSTGKNFSPEDLQNGISELSARIKSALGTGAPAAFGLGTAGAVLNGVMSVATNLPKLEGMNAQEILSAVVHCPVKIDNDANCFALAEARFGAGKGARHLCAVTIGTGVGCGIIIDGKVHQGAHAQAGEIWSIPLRDRFLEFYLSGLGVAHSYEISGGEAGAIDAAKVADLARAGDAIAIKVWHQVTEDLHFLCEVLAAVVDPEMIVIGGSLAQSRDLFADELERKLSSRNLPIAYAALGTSAGVIGAASLNLD